MSTAIYDILRDAANRVEAVARLKRAGYFLLSVEPVRGHLISEGIVSRRALRGISKEGISVFTSQLASLLKAGLPLATALNGLEEQMAGTPLADVIEHDLVGEWGRRDGVQPNLDIRLRRVFHRCIHSRGHDCKLGKKQPRGNLSHLLRLGHNSVSVQCSPASLTCVSP